MRVKTLRFREFKRFSDLIVTGISETAKLVVVIGPNGCGKVVCLRWIRKMAR